MRVLILGAGGHGQVVANALLHMREAGTPVTPLGYLDDDPGLKGRSFFDLTVFGPMDRLSDIPHECVVVAVGDNVTRQRLFDTLDRQGQHFAIARHRSAVIAPDVYIGAGSTICAGVVVNSGSAIGANIIMNIGCTVDHHNRIGDHVHIAPGVHLGGDVIIREAALVGIGATVMPGRCVGAWTVVGAGSLVRVDLPDGLTAVGVLARVVPR